MKKFGWRFLGFVASLALMPAILLTCVQWRVSSMDYFREEYAKYDVLERVDMEMDDLLYLTEEMMAYLYDKREELQVTVPIGGEELPFFSEKEIRHMVDVKNLFPQAWISVMAVWCLPLRRSLSCSRRKKEGHSCVPCRRALVCFLQPAACWWH